MRYVNAKQAAQLLQKSEKTIGKWIKDGELEAKSGYTSYGVHEWRISWEEIRQKRVVLELPVLPEEGIPELPVLLEPHQIAAIFERLERLEKELEGLKKWKNETEKKRDGEQVLLPPLPSVSFTAQRTYPSYVRNEHPETSVFTPNEVHPENYGIPANAISARQFSAQVGVPRRTLENNIKRGIRGDYIPAIIRYKPGRPHELEMWLTEEMQKAAKEFFRRHGKI